MLLMPIQEVQSSLRCEELEAERVAYTEKVNALEVSTEHCTCVYLAQLFG